MAKSDDKEENKKPKVTRRKQQTVRERTQTADSRPKRLRNKASSLKTPLVKAHTAGKREFHLPLPDNRLGRILSKRVRLIPGFVRNSWAEIRQVTWPNRSETARLTIAVFIFSIVFATIIGLLDFVLDKVFREVIIKR